MNAFTKEFTDLDQALDEIRSIPEEWSAAQDGHGPADEMVHYASLVLYEWIANLHQYAQFQDRTPTIKIRLSSQDRHISCSVLDNSDGFDLDEHLPAPDDDIETLPEGGMGLRIINSCTESLSYTATQDGHQRFEFFIPSDHDPWLNTLF